MRGWHSLYEILLFPISVLLFAYLLLGIGNVLTNEAFHSLIHVESDLVTLLANASYRTGSLLIVNFPLIFLIRIVVRKSGSAATVISAFTGYIVYLVTTMYFSRSDLPSTAYSSVLGISMTSRNNLTMQSGVHYPLQTGIVATAIIAVITLTSYSHSRSRSEYSFMSFISKDTWCVIRTAFLSLLAGIAIAYVWPYFIDAVQASIDFISRDTTNPVNLALYGILDRFLGVLNLGTLMRSPFWYSSNGGSWISMAGTNIAGDVNIWTNQLATNSLSGMTGRFITPYYVMNIFAMPGLLWAMFSMETDLQERRKKVWFFIIATIMSVFGGTMLPIELTLLFLSPLLFFMHVGYTGILYGLFQSMHVYLGFHYTGTSTLAVCPGTLLEMLSYLQNGTLVDTVIKVAIVGGVSFFAYFFMTRFYFKHLALDLFHTGVKDDMIKGTVKAAGGLVNIRMIHSSTERLVLSLYDPQKLDVNMLRQLGALKVTETKAGYAIAYGASSSMIAAGIKKNMRQSVRNT